MIAMHKTFFNKRAFLMIAFVGVMCAVLAFSIEISSQESTNLENAFFLARDGHLDVNYLIYSADIITCTMNLLLFIPLISRVFIDDYEIVKSFLFVRMDDVSKWFTYKSIQSALYCLYASSVYNVVLLCLAALVGNKADNPEVVFEYLILGILAGTLILYMVVLGNNILSLKLKPHLCTAFSSLFMLVMMITMWFCKTEQIQYHLFQNYFISWHLIMSPNAVYYTYPAWVAYTFIVCIILLEYIIGNRVIKKIDIL